MHLYIVRHGIAIDREDPKCPPDPERELTDKGRDRTREAAQGLLALGIKPDAMLSSPYIRAVQTAEVMAEVFGFSMKKIKKTPTLLSDASPDNLFEELMKTKGDEVFCFGHAPNVDEVLAYGLGLDAPVTSLKKAGVACLDVIPSREPKGELVFLYDPKVLRLATA